MRIITKIKLLWIGILAISSFFLTSCKDDAAIKPEAQIASTQPETIRPVLELLSLTSCVGCYLGDTWSQSSIDDPKFNGIVIHNFGLPAVQSGEVHPTFTHKSYEYLREMIANDGFPEGTINRRVFPKYAAANNKKQMALIFNKWGPAASTILGEIAKVNVGLELTKTADKNYKLKYEYFCTEDITPEYRIHIVLLQSNIKAFLRGQGDNYIHNHVCRGYLTGHEGEMVNSVKLKKGSSSLKEMNIILPEFYGGGDLPTGGGKPDPAHMEVVVFVTSQTGDIVGVNNVKFPG